MKDIYSITRLMKFHILLIILSASQVKAADYVETRVNIFQDSFFEPALGLDPCLNYYDPGINKLCIECTVGFILFPVSPEHTICATDEGDDYYCSIDYSIYPTVENKDIDYIWYWGEIYQEQIPDGSTICFSCEGYYVDELYDENGAYVDITSKCWYCGDPDELSFVEKPIYKTSYGCAECSDDYLDQSLLKQPGLPLKIRQCANRENGEECTLTQYYDTKLEICISCSDIFSNCASCGYDINNVVYCSACATNFYKQEIYNYKTQQNDIQCTYDTCPAGQGKNSVTLTCEDCTTDNCFQCEEDRLNYCMQCNKGFYSDWIQDCPPFEDAIETTLFINSKIITNKEDAGYATFISDLGSNTGESVGDPYYFIPQALTKIATLAYDHVKVTVTIYLGKGKHFFFFCNGVNSVAINKLKDVKFISFCTDIADEVMNQKYKDGTDDVTMHFLPLDCSLGVSLGLTGNTDFNSMCVQTTDPKPEIIVNQNHAYFNISGQATFTNLRFSGYNALVQPTNQKFDLSVYPTLMCELDHEVVNDDLAGALKMKLATNQYFSKKMSYSCNDTTTNLVTYQVSNIPMDYNLNSTCTSNGQSVFYELQTSTLACPGEPTQSTFWTLDSTTSSGFYHLRRHTLFNLFAFAEYQSVTGATPSIEISNCEFSYFLKDYESLINVETNNFFINKFVDGTTTYNFIKYNGADKGAKIKISDSIFKNSRFCKGLITYRKQPYISKTLAFTNLTHIYMDQTNTGINDYGSYIIIENSQFLNLNIFSNVTALAYYDGKQVQTELNTGLQVEYPKIQQLVHKGIVLNVEDFGGYIEIVNNKFYRNMHFIPEALNTPHQSGDVYNFDKFKDQYKTKEYKMSICQAGIDQYMFQSGISQDVDIESYFDTFERLGVIYISRNRDLMVIRNNDFQNNIGTFGGAITINSPNWDSSVLSTSQVSTVASQNNIKPYVIIVNNNFQNNMAYFSGNAIYIRNTQKASDLTNICGGVFFDANAFSYNIGTKKHNGGAVTAICTYLTDVEHEDYNRGSSISLQNQDITLVGENQEFIVDKIDSNTNFKIYSYKFVVKMSTFLYNYGGGKGTAIFIKYMSKVKFINNDFQYNGPVYVQFENAYSPYKVFLSPKKPFSFYVPNSKICTDEFSFMESCNEVSTYIDWPHVKGAVYIEQCQESKCININQVQSLEITLCTFRGNDAGPVLDDKFPADLTSTLSLIGGFSNSIYSCEFFETAMTKATINAPHIVNYFPAEYFQLQMATLISIRTVANPSSLRTFQTTIDKSQFHQNQNIQVIGFESTSEYLGGLIYYFSSRSATNTKLIPLLTISNTKFTDNKFLGHQSSLIYIYNVLLKLEDCQFLNNGQLYSETLTSDSAKLINTGASVYYNFGTYSFSQSQQYGIILIAGDTMMPDGKVHDINSNTFQFTFAQQGSVYSIQVSNQYVHLNTNIYNYNFASYGSIMVATSLGARATIKFENENINYQFNQLQGSICLLAVDQDLISLWVTKSIFTNTLAKYGASLYVEKAAKILIEQSTFTFTNRLTADNIRKVFTKQSQNLDKLIDSPFLQLLAENTYLEESQVFLSNTKNTKSVVFGSQEVQDLSNQYLGYSEIRDCNFNKINSTQASAITIQQGNARIYNSAGSYASISKNQQINKGVISISNSAEVICQNLLIQDNLATSSSSAVAVSDSKATFQNTVFRNNKALVSALITIESDSYFECSSCLFDKNYANDTSTILGSKNTMYTLLIKDSTFTENYSESNLMYLIFSNVQIINTRFVDNISKFINNGITVISSQLTASRIFVDYTKSDFLNDNDYYVDSGFFNVLLQSTITLNDNSILQNCRGGIASVMYVTGSSNVNIDGNTYFMNCKSSVSSTIMLTNSNQVNIANAHFYNNDQYDIYFDSSDGNISHSTFQYGELQYIYADVSTLSIYNTSFQDSWSNVASGQAVFCNCLILNITDCLFQNLSGVEGGALFISSVNDKSYHLIQGSKFIDNQGMQGGAINIQDSVKMDLFGNQFIDNLANVTWPPSTASSKLNPKGYGGAIYYQCLNEKAMLDSNCTVNIMKKNVFVNNTAQNDGGAIIWTSNRYYEDNSTVYEGNKALYGNNVATYPQQLKIEFISNNDYVNQSKESGRRVLHDLEGGRILDQAFPTINSGTPIDFIIYIIDQEGNVFASDNSSIAIIKQADESQRVILVNNEVTAKLGVYNFKKMEIDTQPGSQISLKLEIQGLQTFGNKIGFLDIFPEIKIQLRHCVTGEELTSDNRCATCGQAFYLYDVPSSTTNCKDCLPNSYCYGGNIVSPNAGYWRSSETSENFIECPQEKMCLGGNQTYPQGRCFEGYSGVLCAECNENYSSTGPQQCGKCPPIKRNIIQISFILFAGIFIVAYMVRSTLSGADKDMPVHSVYMKIMANHFQILSAIQTINYKWPKQINDFQKSQGQVTGVTQQFLSFDCFLMGSSYDIQSDGINRVYYKKLIMYALLPIVFTGIASLFWYVYSKIRKSVTNISDKIISTIVVVLFLVHPNITQVMFSFFNCMDVDGKQRLTADLHIVCYEGWHSIFMFTLALPSVLLWVFGIPLFALLLLIRDKKQIMLINAKSQDERTEEQKEIAKRIKQKFGFLFQGYRVQRFFWEIILLYRKILIIMIAVFLSVVSPESQVLCAMFILIISMTLHIRYHPFQTKILNRMEQYSQIVAGITMYAGMFYIVGQHYTYMDNDGVKWFFLLCIVTPNICYFVYWGLYMRLEILRQLVRKNKRKLFKIASFNIHKFDEFKAKYVDIEDEQVEDTPVAHNKNKVQDGFSTSIKPRETEQKLKEGDELNLADIQIVFNDSVSKEKPNRGQRYQELANDSPIKRMFSKVHPTDPSSKEAVRESIKTLKDEKTGEETAKSKGHSKSKRKDLPDDYQKIPFDSGRAQEGENKQSEKKRSKSPQGKITLLQHKDCKVKVVKKQSLRGRSKSPAKNTTKSIESCDAMEDMIDDVFEKNRNPVKRDAKVQRFQSSTQN